MASLMKEVLRRLPEPVSRNLRLLRDQLAIRTFRPRIVHHSYGGFQLAVGLADGMSARWYDQDWPELPEIRFFKPRRPWEGALIFDLGAHQGVVALMLARMAGSSGRVVAVEAGRRNFSLAVENKRLNQADNLTLLHAVVDSASGSSVRFGNQINGSVSAFGAPVVSRSIDDLASQYGVPDLVLVDIEGYEHRALAGAGETLQRCPLWCVEVHAGCGLESFGGSAGLVVQIFKDRGFGLYGYVDQKDDVRPLSQIPTGRFFLIAVRD
jgi:FkbM family methyltransferase